MQAGLLRSRSARLPTGWPSRWFPRGAMWQTLSLVVARYRLLSHLSFFFFFFFFFFLYSEPKSPSHRVNKEQTGDGTGRTQPTSGLGILMCPAHQMKIYRREREREREREPEREREGCAT